MLKLDTHVLVTFLAASLTAKEQDVMARGEWVISDIVLWELAMLARHRLLVIASRHLSL
jgi:predicted nucleic acid-binding protein